MGEKRVCARYLGMGAKDSDPGLSLAAFPCKTDVASGKVFLARESRRVSVGRD